MSRLAELFGSNTRASTIEALAYGVGPLTAYRISRMYNLNTAKVYLEVKRLTRLDLVKAVKGPKGKEYSLTDESLRGLVNKLATRTVTYREWRSPKSKARRLRDGLVKVPKFSIRSPGRESEIGLEKASRLRGELDTLALLARKKFDRKYRRMGDRAYARV